MLAIIRTGGKQYIVKKGEKVKIEKIEKEEGKDIDFTDVLLRQKEKTIEIGTPTIAGAKVTATVIEQGREKKVIVFKYKPKKRSKKKKGHRQPFTKIEIKEIK